MSVRNLKSIIGFTAVAFMVQISPAFAGASAGDGTVGGVTLSVMNAFSNFPFLLTAMAYITGLYFAITGIFKFKDHVDSPSQHPISAGVKRFLAGGMLLSGPYMAQAVYGALFTSIGANQISSTGRHGNPGGGGMDQMVYNVISNIAGPMESLLTAFTYISAIALLLLGITRLTKTAQEGPRGPAGMGTIMTFLAAGALFSFGDMMGSFSSSLFGGTTVTTYATISPTVISDSADAARISAVIESVMAFIMIVGYIAFIRGWFVLKAFADGNSQVSLMQAFTFLFGGALAINLGQLINVLQTTLGISGISFS